MSSNITNGSTVNDIWQTIVDDSFARLENMHQSIGRALLIENLPT